MVDMSVKSAFLLNVISCKGIKLTVLTYGFNWCFKETCFSPLTNERIRENRLFSLLSNDVCGFFCSD